jgi:hypothetical protein
MALTLTQDDLDAIAAAVWAYVTRVLTAPASGATSPSAGLMTILHGSAYPRTITGLGDISSRTGLVLTLKSSLADADADAILQLEETNGVLILNSATTGFDADLGSLVVDDETTGAVTITLTDELTAELPLLDNKPYDLKMFAASGSTVLETGVWTVTRTATRRYTATA